MGIDEHPFDRLVAALEARGATIQRRSSDKVRATCPAHADGKPSLAITRIEGGVLMNCFAGCRNADIVKAVGLHLADLFSGPRPARARPTIVARYSYCDHAGVVIAEKVRLEPKGFAWRHPDPSTRSGFRWGLDGRVPGLYGVRNLIGAPSVFIPEGEKAADQLASLGLVATCGPLGAGAWRAPWSADLLEAVSAGATIAILPDKDRAGARHAERVAADLHAHAGDKAIVVKIVPLSGLPPGGDVADYLEAHTRDDLLDLVASTPVWSPGAAERQRAERRNQQAAQRMRTWRKDRAMKQAASSVAKRARRHEETLRVALMAVLDALHTAGQPRSGLQLKEALKGAQPHVGRDVIDHALRVGCETAVLAFEPGPRRAKLYRPGGADVRSVTHSAGHSRPSVRIDRLSPDTRLATLSEQISVSESPVTPFAVTQGERTSQSLQEESPLARTRVNTGVTEPPDTEPPDTGGRDTRTQQPAAVPRFVPQDPYRPLDPGATPVDFYDPSYVRGSR